MIKKERTYYIILGVLVFVFILFQILKPKPLDWTESFSGEDKIPYGGYILHELLPYTFSEDEDITINQAPIFEYADTTNPEKNWIFINTSFAIDQFETEILLSQIEEGADVFIAARNFSQALPDTLELTTSLNNPFLGGGFILDDDTSHVNFTNPSLKRENGFPYLQSTTETFFSNIDSTLQVTKLGTNEQGNTNFLRIRWGEGNIYLHSNPTLFTNYFVREETGADYALTALSYLPNRTTVWDEYYKDVRSAGGSVVRYVVSDKHLSWAWFLSLSGVVLFMIFRAKRKQRIIPVIEKPKNSSIEFTKTIGSLYLEKGNHKLIADKKIRFFFDYIRTNLGLNTQEIDDQLKKDVSLRSGIDQTEVYSLFDLIDMASGKEKISQQELKLLTERIDQFYNQSQR
ncbi:MAG TPA: DUF4350 domain-containing protein [Gracilimonas sp.]|uniref:DUF4350 domain-containing protein n=1 Tax=Gracilimonas sp. TaxID=1974203 RepID=UPI002DA8B951|nr:DUF4350 domain-containing protein [Gracilimonas sp.]